MEKAIVIVGEENVKAVQAMTRLFYWRTTAYSRKYGFNPRKGYTIRAFNAEYDKKAKTWEDVRKFANEMIVANRAEWDKAS